MFTFGPNNRELQYMTQNRGRFDYGTDYIRPTIIAAASAI